MIIPPSKQGNREISRFENLYIKGFKMNFTKITLSIALLGVLTLGMADDATTNTAGSTSASTSASTSTSVDTQIQAIQTAPAQERVQLMNEFKQKLMNMNDAQRSAAIEKLQEKMQAIQTFSQTTQEKAHDASNMRSQMGAMTATRAKGLQMQVSNQMNHMQTMTQQQAGNQFMQTVGAGAGVGAGVGAGAGAGMPTMNTHMMQPTTQPTAQPTMPR